MNKYQEAYDYIAATNGADGIISQMLELQKLVNKATSMKVKKQEHAYSVDDEYIYTNGICPNCQKWVGFEPADNYDYCQYCGQALDWGDEE